MASRRTRIGSSSLLCSRHDSPPSRSGRHRHRSLRRTLDTQRKLTGRAISPVLEGRAAVISFITVAELGYGARLAGWGPERLRRLEYEIARAEIVWPGPRLAEAYASLRTWCVRTGHGLGQKDHEADRWVAATAIWLQTPLVTHDRIFANVKDLELLTKLTD
jgi:predicted nucleic acid-binding protein